MELEHLKNSLPYNFYPKKGVEMNRRFSVALLLSTIAAIVATASSNAATPDGYTCSPKANPYKSTFCVYFTGAAENVDGTSYTVVMHYLNLSGKPIRRQVNAYVSAGNGDTVYAEAPIHVASPVKYVMSGDNFTPLARIIGLPGGLKAHQNISLKLKFKITDPGPNRQGFSFLVRFWIGPLMATSTTPVAVNTFYPKLIGANV